MQPVRLLPLHFTKFHLVKALLQHIVNDKPKVAASLQYTIPEREFWDEYVDLWNNSLYKPAFKSPHYVQYLANKFSNALTVYKFYLDGKLYGAAFFRKEGNEYRLLTDIKADHNFFLLHKQCTEDDIAAFFGNLLSEIKKENWALSLLVQPAWASYMDAFIKSMQASGLFTDVSKRSVCPVLEEETPKKLFERLNSSRELRYRMNRIKSQLEGVFEIFRGDEDLDEWVNSFCELHRKRWENTDTPSRYQGEEIKFLKECMKAWIDDDILVRFSIKVGVERIAFVICLIQEDRLIHHSTAYNEDYYKYSPGKALILAIGQWMELKGLNVLDFGEGAEPYKYSYTNKELILNQISISSYSNVPFILKVKFKKVIRKKINANPKIKKFYKEKIKPLARGVKA